MKFFVDTIQLENSPTVEWQCLFMC